VKVISDKRTLNHMRHSLQKYLFELHSYNLCARAKKHYDVMSMFSHSPTRRRTKNDGIDSSRQLMMVCWASART